MEISSSVGLAGYLWEKLKLHVVAAPMAGGNLQEGLLGLDRHN